VDCVCSHCWQDSLLVLLQLMWRFNQEAVALRIQYLMNTKEGAESHTVLVTDIPVLEFGTIPHRIETTVFRYLPVRIKVRSHIQLASSVSRRSAVSCHACYGALTQWQYGVQAYTSYEQQRACHGGSCLSCWLVLFLLAKSYFAYKCGDPCHKCWNQEKCVILQHS